MKRSIIWIVLGVLLCLLVFEIWFDIFEVITGKMILLTNSTRPQTGRLWEEENKELNGDAVIDSLAQNIVADTLTLVHFTNVYDLHSELLLRKKVVMSHKDFIDFYRIIPVQSAKQLQDPMKFLELYHNPQWESVKIILNDQQLSIYFLDGFGQPLNERYVDLESLLKNGQSNYNTRLADKKEFQNRIISAEEFYKAFLSLPLSYRLQIMNDPYRLVSWGDNLVYVGISSTVNMGAVDLAFEIISESQSRIYTSSASEIAVEYLINAINNQAQGTMISKPQSGGR